jgi:hypothetical protein
MRRQQRLCPRTSSQRYPRTVEALITARIIHRRLEQERLEQVISTHIRCSISFEAANLRFTGIVLSTSRLLLPPPLPMLLLDLDHQDQSPFQVLMVIHHRFP